MTTKRAAVVLRWYVVKYGGTRGPVAHLVVEYSSATTVCGLHLRTAGGTPNLLTRGQWGQPSRSVGPGIALCKNCDRMKDADTMQPRARVVASASSSSHGRVAFMALEIEGTPAEVDELVAAIGERVAILKGGR